jgi:O-antigen ligase
MRLQVYIVAAVLALVPMVVAPGVLLYFDVTPKVIVLILSAALLLAFCNPLGAGTGKGSRTCRAVEICLGVQLLSLILSTFVSVDPTLSVTGGAWRRSGLITQAATLVWCVMLCRELTQSKRSRIVLLRALTIGAIGVALAGLIQYGVWSFHSGPIQPWQAQRPYGTMGHPVYFANFLLAPALLCVGTAIEETSVVWKRLAGAGGLLAGLAVVLSGTRSSIIGLLVGWALFAVWAGRQYWRRYVPLLLAGIALFAVFALLPAGYLWRSRVQHWFQDAQGGPRLWLWRDTAGMIARRPWFGYGPDTFAQYFPRYESADFARAYPDFYHESPHNMFLDVTVSQGVLGLIAALALIGIALHCCWKYRRTQRLWPAAMLGALAAELVAHQFACFMAPTAMIFYFAALLPVSLDPGGGALEPPTPGPRWLLYGQRVAGVILTLFAIELLGADRALGRVARDLRSASVESAVADYHAALQWSPPGFGSDLWYSRSLLLVAERQGKLPAVLKDAEEAAKRATETAEDRHNAYYHSALIYAGQYDFAHAETELRNAIAWDPVWFKPYWLLAQVLAAGKRLPEALQCAEQAAYLSGGRKPEVDQYLSDLRRGSNDGK